MLRHIARSAARHGHRFCSLLDAQAVLGAVSKGRSSAGTLRREICRIGALSAACDLVMRYCYVPSESNPVDAPSRGVKQGGPSQKKAVAVKKPTMKKPAHGCRKHVPCHMDAQSCLDKYDPDFLRECDDLVDRLFSEAAFS